MRIIPLLEQSIRDKLHLRLQQQLPPDAGWNQDHLRILAVNLLEQFRSLHGRCSLAETINPVFERTMQQEIKSLLTSWLQRLEPEDSRWIVPLDAVTLAASWTLYGSGPRMKPESKCLQRGRNGRLYGSVHPWRDGGMAACTERKLKTAAYQKSLTGSVSDFCVYSN